MTIELSAGQDVALVDGDGRPWRRLTIGLGWDDDERAGLVGGSAREVDLDASAFQFADGALFDLAFYNNVSTRDGSVVHQGDNQSGDGEGDDESVTVDLTRVHGPVGSVVVLLSSYQGHELRWVCRLYCRVLDEEGREFARFTLDPDGPETGMVMARLVRGEDAWHLVAIGASVAATVPTAAVKTVQRYA